MSLNNLLVKVKKLGRLVVYNPKALIVHYKGESMKTAPFNVNNIFYKSLLTFYKKNGSRLLSSLLFRPIIFISYKLKNLIFRVKSKLNILIQMIFDVASIVASYSIALFLWYPLYYHAMIDLNLYIKHIPILFSYIFSWIFISLSMRYYRRGNVVNGDIFTLNILEGLKSYQNSG